MFILLTISEDGSLLFHEIYNAHYKKMLYAAVKILGQPHGEDAVHDTFEKLMVKFENNYEFLRDKPGQYFVIIVRNHSLNMLRKKQAETVPFDEEFEDYDIFRSDSESPEESLIYAETKEMLAALIRLLTPVTRQIVEYKFIEGLPNKKIAELMDMSQTAVSSQIDRAIKKLRELAGGEVQANEIRE